MIQEKRLQIQERMEGTLVPDGFSCSIREGDFHYKRFHVILQETLKDGTVIRFKIAIPKEGAIEDPSTWIVTQLIRE